MTPSNFSLEPNRLYPSPIIRPPPRPSPSSRHSTRIVHLLILEFAQVGNDQKATRFLEELDNHPQIGGLVDCTSNFELEQEEMMRKSGVDLTPEMWLVKLLMGPIDSSYDTKDE